MPRHIGRRRADPAVQTLVVQQVGALRDVLPRREGAGFLAVGRSLAGIVQVFAGDVFVVIHGLQTALEALVDHAPVVAALLPRCCRAEAGSGSTSKGLAPRLSHAARRSVRTTVQVATLDIAGTPLMRSWFVAQLSARQLAPAAEAFRYFVLEHGEIWLAAHDAALLRHPGSAQA